MAHSLPLPMPATRRHVPIAWLVGTSVLALAANAQPSATPIKPDPLDATASVPAPTYASPFTRYRRLGDEKPVPWRDANDTVTRIGGWRVYAREAQQPDAAKSAPVPVPHGGHKMP